MSRRNHRHRNRSKNRGGGGGGGGQNPNRGPGQPRGDQQGHRPNNNRPNDIELLERKIIPKKYGIVFFDTLNHAKADLEAISVKAKEVDQLNIVIKAEGAQVDEELKKLGKMFVGEAWHLIHTRRVEEGWYNEPR